MLCPADELVEARSLCSRLLHVCLGDYAEIICIYIASRGSVE